MQRPAATVATKLIRAAWGGTIADDEGRLRLLVPALALAVDTTVTIVPVAAGRAGSRVAFGAWRFIAYPGPAVLATGASLSVSIPADAPAAGLELLIANDATALDDDWHPVPATLLADRWLDALTWYLPPSHGPPPTRSSALICLAAKVPKAARGS